MNKNHEVRIDLQYLKQKIVIPGLHVLDFIEYLENNFVVKDSVEAGAHTRSIDGCGSKSRNPYLWVSYPPRDEDKFYDLLKQFCEERGITFCDPRQK